MSNLLFRGALFVAAVLFLAGCGGQSGPIPRTGRVSGKVVAGNPATATLPQADVPVMAYQVPPGETDYRNGWPLVQQRTAEDGTFAMSLPQGRYVLLAQLPVDVSPQQFKPVTPVVNASPAAPVSGIVLGYVPIAP